MRFNAANENAKGSDAAESKTADERPKGLDEAEELPKGSMQLRSF